MKLPAGLFLLRVGGSPVRSGLLVEDNQFPELTTADELIAPLIYLTTSQERQKLFDAPDPKKAVDQFWLTVAANSQPIARQLIRTYYGRVAEASQLFSAHKAGWLTDRGLLYLVLGPPESVYREAGIERWVYRADVERSGTFIFRAKPSTFAPDNYELVRRPEYEQLWYAAVEQWRKGRTARPGR
ncbi:GWxTD domain-containing protein [Hymenobacter rigui]|nr:GWxTD domain-containing protein [Hymenobacter rigui]